MKVYVKTDIGKRDNNEDSYYIDPDEKLFMLADGMGGHLAGEYASNLAIKVIKEELQEQTYSEDNIAEILESAIETANSEIFYESSNNLEYRGMGTTLSLSFIYEELVYFVNIGDSRVYSLEDKKLSQLTVDDSFVNYLLQIGDITEQEAKHHPKKNILTKALGTSEKIEFEIFAKELSNVEMLLLCSDGLSDVMETDEIEEILNRHETIDVKAETLIQTALAKGTKDNVTVILLDRE